MLEYLENKEKSLVKKMIKNTEDINKAMKNYITEDILHTLTHARSHIEGRL